MKSLGKIIRLPRDIREQLNRRLYNGDQTKPILEWLNALPEVQSVIQTEFDGAPITRQNLTKWRRHGYRNWEIRQSALEFALGLEADQAALPKELASSLTEKLSHWIALRYAAAAQAMTASDTDPEKDLLRLRQFCGDIVALRRGDLSAGRLQIEQARLAAEQATRESELERLFWAWVQRPEIQAKLYPNKDQGDQPSGPPRHRYPPSWHSPSHHQRTAPRPRHPHMTPIAVHPERRFHYRFLNPQQFAAFVGNFVEPQPAATLRNPKPQPSETLGNPGKP